jgi:signal transduction histidine kinase
MKIRNKLFIGISILVLLFISLAVFFNQTFLLSFYIRETQTKLIIDAKSIDSRYNGNIKEAIPDLRKMEWNSGIHIIIFDRQLELKYMSQFQDHNLNPEPEQSLRNSMPFPPLRMEFLTQLRNFLNQLRDNEKGHYAFQNNPETDKLISFINCGYILNNGDILVLNRPLAELKESAGVANRFLMLSGFIICLIGIIVVYVVSRRLTRPIIELRDMAHDMAGLNFSHKFIAHSNDEIAELGISINSLSRQLDMSINELNHTNQKLREDIDREKKLEEMRRDFVSSVSHELKTPIALIMGYAEGLKDGVAKRKDRDYYCNVMMDESKKLDLLLKDLLDLSQFDSGVFRLSIKQFDLKEKIEEILQKYTPLINDKKIKLTLAAQSTVVNADPSRIEQVIVNYLNNAIDHCEGERRIHIRIEKSGDFAEFALFNSGKPVPEEALEKIWLRFYKTDSSRNRSFGGTGLGLAIVRAILELHDAPFGARNLPGGVEFYFRLRI